ncbi:hypothetical protein [Limosilactobacillus fermentum]|uniref:hypothetical protein n=1 Tax=Limosilactobacillus fermentum TaxID=1613 RepID=UPI0031CCE67A
MNDLTVITIEHPESGRENSLIENGVTGARIEQKAIEDKTALFINTPDDKWSPVNKIDNLNRDFFVLCHD